MDDPPTPIAKSACGPCSGRLLLVVVDAFSKWPEVHIVLSTLAQQTIDKLRYILHATAFPPPQSQTMVHLFNLQSFPILLQRMASCNAKFHLTIRLLTVWQRIW